MANDPIEQQLRNMRHRVDELRARSKKLAEDLAETDRYIVQAEELIAGLEKCRDDLEPFSVFKSLGFRP